MKLHRYLKFINEAFLPKDKEKAIDLILQYLERKSGIKFYSYDEIWNVKKGSNFFRGQLFLSLFSSKALRFNWIEDDIREEIHSIDLWENFSFETNPDFSLLLNQNSIVQVLPDILNFLKNPKMMVGSTKDLVVKENTEFEGTDPQQRLDFELKKLSRMKNPERIELQKMKIQRLQALMSETETSETDSLKVNQLDAELNIDVFKTIELYTIQVAKRRSNSLIISGDPGVGKTQVVKDSLNSIGMSKDEDYVFSTGTATTAGLYELLFKNRKKLLVFDDCDAVLKDAESINILKGALDTYEIREISKLTKSTTFDSTGMTDEEMDEEYNTSGKVPNKFDFTGQIIFISNLPEDKFDKAILSRSLHVDVHLTKQELFERMKNIMRRISPDVEYDKKLEALEYLTGICESYPTKFDLNIRTLIHAINLRAHNEELIDVAGRQEPVWKLLIKKYLVKSR